MNTHARPTPGRPLSPKPPTRLVKIADSLHHPDVTRVGLTTTSDGHWALMVHVKAETPTPIAAVEAACAKFPVVYQEDRRGLPIARPAYPALGE